MRTVIAIAALAGCSSDGAPPAANDAPIDPAIDSGTDALVDDPGPAPTQDCPFTPDADGFFTLNSGVSDYVVRLPVGYDVANPQPKPLLVAIHGCGDSAMNFATWGAVPYALRGAQDYIAISIGGRDGQCWTLSQDVPKVHGAMGHVQSCFFVHHKKIVVAGYSSGGMMAYKLGITDAPTYAGILIENSSLSAGVGNVTTALGELGWKINIAHSARTEDDSFPIDGVRTDRDALLAAQVPLNYRELPGTHDGTSDDWSEFLIPAMTGWRAP